MFANPISAVTAGAAWAGTGLSLSDELKEKWENIYRCKSYYLGVEADDFLAEQLAKMKSGEILFPGEGEGRNAVFAAKQGWHTHAFDPSSTGRKNALALAARSHVSIDYWLADFERFRVPPESYDTVAIIDLPAPPEVRGSGFALVRQALKPGGFLIYEGYEATYKPPLWPTIGELQSAFADFNFQLLTESNVKRQHGYTAQDRVLRAVAQKPGYER